MIFREEKTFRKKKNLMVNFFFNKIPVTEFGKWYFKTFVSILFVVDQNKTRTSTTYMSGFVRFILVNYKQDLLGKNTGDNIGTFVLKGNELVSFEDKSTNVIGSIFSQ